MKRPLRIALLASASLHLVVIASLMVPLRELVTPGEETDSVSVQIALRQPSPSPASSVPAPSTPEPREEKVARAPQQPQGSGPEPPPLPETDPSPGKATERSVVMETDKTPAESKNRIPKPAVPNPQVRQRYLERLAARIQQRKFYPSACRRLGEQGQVVIGFVIRRDGRLADIRVIESSGYPRLDEAALRTVQRVSPFEPVPSPAAIDPWSVRVPIDFRLR